MKSVIRMVVVIALVSLFVATSFTQAAADKMLVYNSGGDFSFYSRGLISDGSGALMLDAASQDNLGVWGGAGYDAFMGDIDGDHCDEMIVYKQGIGFYARKLISDGSGGLMLDSSFTNFLGNWGGVGYKGFAGDVDGDSKDEMIVYNTGGDFSFNSRKVISNGSGGFMLDASSQDNLGIWGGTGYDAFMGDLNGDGHDEMLVYNSGSSFTFYSRKLISDGSGGLMLDGSSQDNLGIWGGTGYKGFMGDINGDNFDEMIVYLPGTGFYARKLISDGSGGLMLDSSSTDFLGNWGGTGYDAFMGNVVPEPATVSILLLGGAGLFLRRKSS